MTIAQRIKAWRRRHSFSQSQAARHLGVNIDSLQNWEQGRSEPLGLAARALLASLKAPVQTSKPNSK